MDDGAVADVVAALKASRQAGQGCTLLIGAGCSRSAGIPVADGIVELAQERYPGAFGLAPTKTYPHVMRALHEHQRRDLFDSLLESATVNWAHISIALLFHHGYIDRLYVANFDNLVQRALALVGRFPVIYDASVAPRLRSLPYGGPVVVYLHGQRSGIALYAEREEYDWHATHLAPLFDPAGQNRLWLVAGYDGQDDPVMDLLARVPVYSPGLLWLGHRPAAPEHVAGHLLQPGRGTRYVGSCDADSLFFGVAQDLGLLPPDVLARPLTWVSGLLAAIAPLPLPNGLQPVDLTASIRHDLAAAAATIEAVDRPEMTLVGGNIDQVIARRTEILAQNNPATVGALVWAYVAKGRQVAERARVAEDGESHKGWRYAEAFEYFDAALRIRPDCGDAYLAWGIGLSDLAQESTGAVADRYYAQAYRRFAGAVKAVPDLAEAYYKWANALVNQAETRGGDEALALYADACKKYAAATAWKPDMYTAFNNWGIALSDRAKLVDDSGSAERLYREAYTRFAAATRIRSDQYETYYNWAIALFDNARASEDPDEADRLFQDAYTQYAMAVRLRPDSADTFFSWGSALSMHAQTKDGDEADRLFGEAVTKYASAIVVSPSMVEAYHSWGWACAAWARRVPGPAAGGRFAEAFEKFAIALKLDPTDANICNNWGNALADQALTLSGPESDAVFDKAYAMFGQALTINPALSVALTNWGGALTLHAKARAGALRERLLALAEDKCRQVETMQPGRGAYDLACVAALRGREDECRRWLEASLDVGNLPGSEHLANDADLSLVHGMPWFDGLVATVRDAEHIPTF